MRHFTEQARTYGECMERIRTKYGRDAKVLGERTLWKTGFLGMGGHEEVELTGIYGYEQNGGSPASPSLRSRPDTAPAALDLETAKRQVLAAAGKAAPDASIQVVLKEITALRDSVSSLNEKVDSTLSGSRPPAQEGIVHPSLQKLEEDLFLNDFTPSFVKGILDRARREFPLHELDDYEEVQKRVILWIGEQISVYREPSDPPPREGKKKARIIVLVGPTGVGKTTTVVKLAALYGDRAEGIWQKQVRLITLDRYRIGAESQIQKFGEIMDVPVSTVESYEDLKKLLSLYRQDIDFILIDTIGKSPRNYTDLGEMKAVLDACPAKTELHLCVQASTKGGDLKDILKQFEPFKYKSVIITKVDETSRIGNAISVLAEERKNISFITTGQAVPKDIERAAVVRLLMNLEGFTVDRLALVDHFRSIEDQDHK